MSVPLGVRREADGPIIEVTNSVWAHQSGIPLLPVPPAEGEADSVSETMFYE